MVIEINRPELEVLIRERLDSGAFQNIEDVLLEALRFTRSNEQVVTTSPKEPGAISLESPLRDSGPKLERLVDYPRPIDL